MPSTCSCLAARPASENSVAEPADIRHRNRQHAGKRPEADYLDLRRSAKIRVSHGGGGGGLSNREAAYRKPDDVLRHDVPCRQQADVSAQNGGDGGAVAALSTGSPTREDKAERRARSFRDPHQRDPASDDACSGFAPGKVEIDQPEYKMGRSRHQHDLRASRRSGRRNTSEYRARNFFFFFFFLFFFCFFFLYFFSFFVFFFVFLANLASGNWVCPGVSVRTRRSSSRCRFDLRDRENESAAVIALTSE